jgi:triacylglycerol esterase/lipase EstA (alpha/beta hydrolase family)
MTTTPPPDDPPAEPALEEETSVEETSDEETSDEETSVEETSVETAEGDESAKVVVETLSAAGKAILQAGAWAGRSAKAAYLSVDPSMRQMIAESSALGLTLVAGSQTPDLRLPDDGERAVVFVHGLAGHRGNLVPLQRYFAYRGRKRSVSIGFDDKSSIEVMADQLQQALRELLEVNALPEGRAVDLVAHSMGGIICRLALLDDELAARVDRLLTIATPHEGTQLARYLDTAKTRGLRPDSELLQRLDAQVPWRPGEAWPHLVCFWSRQDLVLLPPESAIVEGAVVVERSECSHNGFLIRPGAIRRIYEAAAEALD